MEQDIQEAKQVEQKIQNITLRGYFNDDEGGGIQDRVFNNIIGHQVGQHWVAIFQDENTTIIFAAHQIYSIRVWKE